MWFAAVSSLPSSVYDYDFKLGALKLGRPCYLPVYWCTRVLSVPEDQVHAVVQSAKDQ